jgi:hypothetical protein
LDHHIHDSIRDSVIIDSNSNSIPIAIRIIDEYTDHDEVDGSDTLYQRYRRILELVWIGLLDKTILDLYKNVTMEDR